MEPEIIDWSSIESIFVEDQVYENLDAPKWFDFSATGHDEQPTDDDDAWFCKPNCKHPKTAEDFKKSTFNSKVKYLRSMNISEMVPFRDRTCRDAKKKEAKKANQQSLESAENLGEDVENKDPNLNDFHPFTNLVSKKAMTKSCAEKNQQLGNSQGNSSKPPRLRSTFSARNLKGGREILNQITEFYSELKKLAKKGSKKGTTEKVLGEMKERVEEKGRVPLLEVKK